MVAVEYRLGDQQLALRDNEHFDEVLALPGGKHVSGLNALLAAAARSVAPGGLRFASTTDRTWKSFIVAVVGAQYSLRVLPRGTHLWRCLVRSAERAAAVARDGLAQTGLRSMRYLLLLHRASLMPDTQVNFTAAPMKAPR